ncbi:kinase-like protein [Tilletiaria anomala UBC 951]|uniref:Kinase-like protein n=1 Tax=Tilletiaria anomala (strain ATCC 24038 / CBS 436.72 / UBC 951) TaxID=1037660 RepID=A0A066VE37_TILAU|nr:kinase-like protein [Tilletiaria anomala UBC 951]KDN38568.1 kinase-like protein [Tilletiaria anomala UBC 951]
MKRSDSSSGLQIVLRTRDHSAIYSPASHSLSLQSRPIGTGTVALRSPLSLPPPEQTENPEEYTFCPTCLRPWNGSRVAGNDGTLPFEPSSTAPHYFRLLAQGPVIDEGSSVGTTRPGTPVDCGGIFDENAGAQGYYNKFFIELRKLGRGGSGQVYLCQHVLNGNKLGTYAVKKIPCGSQSDHLLESLKEVHMMEALQHPNVIHYQHAWIESARLGPFSPVVPTLHVLMMAANGGSLADWIYLRSGHKVDSPQPSGRSSPAPVPDRARAEKLKAAFRRRNAAKRKRGQGHLSEDTPAVHLLREDETISLIHDIASGLSFLHSRGILHLDLKPANALLHWDEDALIPRVLISDFGSSAFLKDSWMRRRSGHTGTMEFMAPETIRVDPRTGQLQELSRKADMWSLGMILHLLLYFKLPYSQVDDVDVLREEMLAYTGWAARPEVPFTHTDSRLLPLLRDLLNIDPTKRPTSEEVLQRLAAISASSSKPEQRKRSASAGKREAEIARSSSLDPTHPIFTRRLSLSPPESSAGPLKLLLPFALTPMLRREYPVLLAGSLFLVKYAMLDLACGSMSRPRKWIAYSTLISGIAECMIAAQAYRNARTGTLNGALAPYLSVTLLVVHTALLAFRRTCCL